MAKKMAIIASKGTLDGAYPPFLLASTAAALGFEAKIFFTFYGLQLLNKELNLKVSPLGNPAMPMPVTVPSIIQVLPGLEWFATWMMKRKLKKKGVASVEELREICIESGVELIACQMTVDLFDFKHENFVDGISSGGAATFLEFASEADITLYI
ncbi:DsrE/DsrF/DrsH-like family protein [Methylophaga sp.]|jgi:peroxiredoxin family protein|uniref:sulfur carrier protein DsrE2 n=1 Tax=Methylophaga sp. TaxID=2024840 RepID=UPI001401BA9A|nr:DsrE/DsrF/DrsH-like family protein [Methylophaga sp.]MTI63430.1 peroxiredoxin family protein [Methylophaga sp.]